MTGIEYSLQKPILLQKLLRQLTREGSSPVLASSFVNQSEMKQIEAMNIAQQQNEAQFPAENKLL